LPSAASDVTCKDEAMVDRVTDTIGPELHRRLGIDLFNGT
jgi:hypothetical protein